jgi:hypothetical protein
MPEPARYQLIKVSPAANGTSAGKRMWTEASRCRQVRALDVAENVKETGADHRSLPQMGAGRLRRRILQVLREPLVFGRSNQRTHGDAVPLSPASVLLVYFAVQHSPNKASAGALDGIAAGLQSVAIPGFVARVLDGTGRVNAGQGAVMTMRAWALLSVQR